jgi:hypothetical protein
MPSNPAPMVQPGQGACQPLLVDVMGPEARWPTAYPVELPRCRQLLAWGAVRWRRFLGTRAALRPDEPGLAPDGTPWTSHAQRPTTA